MKNFGFIKLGFLIILLLGLLTNCEKDEISNTGKLSISFINHSSDMTVVVYSIENIDIPICELKLDNNGKAEKYLNIGNYYIKVASVTFFAPIGFQINSNKTTTILWGSDNGSTIQ